MLYFKILLKPEEKYRMLSNLKFLRRQAYKILRRSKIFRSYDADGAYVPVLKRLPVEGGGWIFRAECEKKTEGLSEKRQIKTEIFNNLNSFLREKIQ